MKFVPNEKGGWVLLMADENGKTARFRANADLFASLPEGLDLVTFVPLDSPEECRGRRVREVLF